MIYFLFYYCFSLQIDLSAIHNPEDMCLYLEMAAGFYGLLNQVLSKLDCAKCVLNMTFVSLVIYAPFLWYVHPSSLLPSLQV